jgi:hypothetical protein
MVAENFYQHVASPCHPTGDHILLEWNPYQHHLERLRHSKPILKRYVKNPGKNRIWKHGKNNNIKLKKNKSLGHE